MAGSVNKVTLLGNVGNEPEIRSTQNGDKIANLSIATTESWKDKNSGERKDRTEWHRVVIFNSGLVGVIERFVNKGSKLYIEGQLQTRKWTDKNGIDKYTTEVVVQRFGGELVLLDSRGSNSGGYNQGNSQGNSQGNISGNYQQSGNNFDSNNYDSGPDPMAGLGADMDLDDEIPF